MTDDIQSIKNLVYSYAEFLDLGDFRSMAELFAHATVGMPGSEHRFDGADAVRQLIEQTVQLYDGTPRTKHVVTNLIVDVDPNGLAAVARSYYTALQAHPQLPLQPILAGRWHDSFEKIDGRWRFSKRLIHNDLVGDVSCHLKGAR